MGKEKLFTIGYGNRTPEEFFQLLEVNKIEILVDVRSKPYSRFRPAFNKNRLTTSLPELGIEYEFKGVELGGLLAVDEALHQQGVEFLTERLKMGHRLVIMCCESDFRECHRHGVAEEVFQQGFEVFHIGKKGELIQHEGFLI